jgi:LacI family transcriptional regulator
LKFVKQVIYQVDVEDGEPEPDISFCAGGRSGFCDMPWALIFAGSCMARSGTRLSDIATRTGFSKNTVSLALRESPRLPKTTRELIQQAANELNYLPNHVAKSLTSRSTKTIGLLLADITNPLLTDTARTVEKALAKLGYGTLFATSNNKLDEEIAAIEMFRSRQVDGMLIYPTRSQRNYEHIAKLRHANFPIVILAPGQDTGVDMVSVDERLGAYKAVRHLIGLGHTSIGAFVSNGSHGGIREKFEGYLQALKEAGIAFQPNMQVEPAGYNPKAGHQAMDLLMSRASPSAVFVASDYMAVGAMHWCQKNKLRVPEDIALIGFDNIELSEFLGTPLSSVNYQTEIITDSVIDRLLVLMQAQGDMPEPRVTLIEPELVLRASTGD